MNDLKKSHIARVEANTLKNQARISQLETTVRNLRKDTAAVQKTAERFAKLSMTHGGK